MGGGRERSTKGQPFSGSGHRCRDFPGVWPTVEIATYSAGKIGACPGAGEAIGRLVSLLAPGATSQAIRIFRQHETKIDFGAIGRGESLRIPSFGIFRQNRLL